MIRFAQENDLETVNRLRRQVNDIHVNGRPDIFKAGWNDELRDLIHVIMGEESKKIVVADHEGYIVGFAVIHAIDKPENPFMKARRFLDIDEFGVDESHRRHGIAGKLISFIREYAKKEGFTRLELNMWEFNQGALAFYEEAGFRTYRRYMDMDLTSEES